MGKVKIRLAMVGNKGAVAGLESDSIDYVDLIMHKNKKDPQAICVEAAIFLRKLADDFDRLSVMDDPFKEKTQRIASKPSIVKQELVRHESIPPWNPTIKGAWGSS